MVTSVAPTYGRVSPDATVETMSFGTPTGSSRIAAAAIEDPPEPPTAATPLARPPAPRRGPRPRGAPPPRRPRAPSRPPRARDRRLGRAPRAPRPRRARPPRGPR